MKRVIRKITATEDFRTFDGFAIDELEEIYPDYRYWALDLGDAETVYIPRNDENPYIGVKYIDGDTWIFGGRVDRKVSFEELCEYMNK